MIVFLRAQLCHLIIFSHALQIGNNTPKYIRIECTKKALKSYPYATPVNKIIGVTRDNMICHLGIRWTGTFTSSCMLGWQTWILNDAYFIAVCGSNKSIAPNKTNTSDVKELGKIIHNAVKAVRGLGQKWDLAQPFIAKVLAGQVKVKATLKY